MYALALVGSFILLIGAFPRYTSRPELFPGIDTPASPGGCASIAAGLAAVAMSWTALHEHDTYPLKLLVIPAGFTALQLFVSRRLMASVARRTGERVGPGPGLVLSILGAVVIGYVVYHVDHGG